jgi:hypothetical protein
LAVFACFFLNMIEDTRAPQAKAINTKITTVSGLIQGAELVGEGVGVEGVAVGGGVVVEEADETAFWLELLVETEREAMLRTWG